jgi:general secretion pathway protein D
MDINSEDKLSASLYLTGDMNLSKDRSHNYRLYKKRYVKNAYNASVEKIPLKDNFKNMNFSKEKQAQRAKLKPIFHDREGVKVSVENIPVAKFIDLVFGSVLRLNYSYSDNVKKSKATISLNMQKETSPRELFDIALAMLNNHNIGVEQLRSLFQFDTRSKTTISKQQQNFIYGRNFELSGLEGQNITVLFPYYYVPINNMLRRGFTKSSPVVKSIVEIPGANVISISGEAKEVHRVLEAARLLDQSTMQHKQAVLFKMKYINSKDFHKRITSLLSASGIPIAKDASSRGVLIVDVPELNSIYVVSSKKSWIRTIQSWQDRFDNVSVLGDESHLFFYKPEFRKAEELVSIVNQLLGNVVGGNTKKDNNSSSSTVTVKEDFAILDAQQNNIMVNTTASKYKEILSHLEKLDKTPKQILIEVTIAEVTLNEQLKYGLQWYFSKGTNITPSQKTFSINNGLTGSIFDGNINVVLDALAKDDLIHVLSSPKLIVLDREAASINVGSQVPVLTSDTVAANAASTDTTRTQTVQYKNTGIILNVTPYVNSRGILTLNISQTVSEVATDTTSSISSPTILNRSIQTKVALKSGETVMLGGLIKDSKNKNKSKVPLLGDLPFFGALFSSTGHNRDKTELFVTVKPTIINNTDDTKIVTNEMRKLFTKIKR